MTKMIERALGVIGGELVTAMKAEAGDVITIGKLLLEAKTQAAHGEWCDWLLNYFPHSDSTATNYMNAAKLAIKFPTIGSLRLRPTTLYFLGSKLDEPDTIYDDAAMAAIFARAETEWVRVSDAEVIAIELLPPSPPPSPEEMEAAFQADMAAQIARHEAAEAEAAALLDEPPPILPPPEIAAIDTITPPFDQALRTLAALQTKPLAKFTGTTHKPRDILAIGDFLHEVSAALTVQATEQSP